MIAEVVSVHRRYQVTAALARRRQVRRHGDVTANYQVIPLRGPGQVKVRCPCCGLTAWREPDDDLAGDDCPYCDVQTERVEETP